MDAEETLKKLTPRQPELDETEAGEAGTAENTEETPQPETPAEGITALRHLATEQDVVRNKMSLRSILGGDILTGDWLRRQGGLIFILVVLALVYIGNRYQSQQELLEINQLKEKLQDIKYDALTRSSELMERSRRSRIEEYLKETNDSMLQTATMPPFKIYVTTKK